MGPDVPGFVRFDLSDPSALTWTNQTSPGPQGIDPPVVHGDSELVYVPLGASGIILLFGSAYLVYGVCSVGLLMYDPANCNSRK